MREHQWLYGTILGTVFWLKVLFFIWVQMMIRWSFLRFRYDQIQTLGWKILLPLGLFNVFATGALVLWDPSLRALALFGILQLGVLVALTVSPTKDDEEPEHKHGASAPHGPALPASSHAAHAGAAPAGAHASAATASSH
jgi:NADH-quinone oxidoreductase subunit H